MIDKSDILAVGKFLKPHGVNGEISLFRDFDTLDLEDYSCVIVDIDGIFVPFFIDTVRPKGVHSDLLTISGIDSDDQVAMLTNKTAYVLKSEVPDQEKGEGDEGLYADDLIGYTVYLEDKGLIGKIIGIEDSTANYLFIVETRGGDNLLIPVAEEFFTDIKPDKKEIVMSLPQGLLEL